MELVIAKQSMTSMSECERYTIPADMWGMFKFEGCYPDGKGTIALNGVIKAQLSTSNDTVTIKVPGTYDVCVLGKNTKSSIYVTLVAAGGGDGKETVVAAGENVTVDKSVDGNITTYTVNAQAGGSNTIVEGAGSVTVTSSSSGDTTTYTVTGTDTNSKTVVQAGQNVTVTSSTSGDTTTYTVSSTAVAPLDQTIYEVASTTPNTLTVDKVASGNTVTFNLAATGGSDVDLESTDPNLIIQRV